MLASRIATWAQFLDNNQPVMMVSNGNIHSVIHLLLAQSRADALTQFTQKIMTQPARMEEFSLYLALFVRQKK